LLGRVVLKSNRYVENIAEIGVAIMGATWTAAHQYVTLAGDDPIRSKQLREALTRSQREHRDIETTRPPTRRPTSA